MKSILKIILWVLILPLVFIMRWAYRHCPICGEGDKITRIPGKSDWDKPEIKDPLEWKKAVEQRIADKCWYYLCYAPKKKDLPEYSKIMAEEIMKLVKGKK